VLQRANLQEILLSDHSTTTDGTKPVAMTSDNVPNNWPFPTYKGQAVVVDNSSKFVDNRKQHHLDFLNEQDEAIF
jgi:hypothetical protein